MKRITFLCFFKVLSIGIFAQTDSSFVFSGFSFGASYVGDFVGVASGGLRSGVCYLGLADVEVGFDCEKAGLWRGTSAFVKVANAHGQSPSQELVGDAQIVSNIDAGTSNTFFRELWIKQTIGKCSLTFGLQDLNVDFATTENGALFINSSFGILPTISANILVPIYPITAPGITFDWQINADSKWYIAIYDGAATEFAYNIYNTAWRFNEDNGNFAVSEYQHSVKIADKSGVYKIGAFVYN